jgi:hypothetical protein
MELQTGKLLDVLLIIFPTDKTRKQINDWLYRNTKPGFAVQLSPDLYIAYDNQRDGHGTAHWWKLSYGDRLKSQIDTFTKGSALTVTDKPKNQANSGVRAPYEWFGMYFRSKVEMKMAQELQKRGVTFFANARGCYSLEDSPASAQYLNGRVEVDFLVFHLGKSIIFQIDGPQHKDQKARDYAVDRVLLRDGMSTIRFTAKECQDRPEKVVTEILRILGLD